MGVKTIKKTIPAKEAKEIEENIFICDLCKRESPQREQFITCKCCGRLVCKNNNECSDYDPHEWGDYPDIFCKTCWSLKFIKYWKIRTKLFEEHNKKLEDLDEKIRKESLDEKSNK